MPNSGRGSSGGPATGARNAAEQAKKVAPKAAAVAVPPVAASTGAGQQTIESSRSTTANTVPGWLPTGIDGAMVFDAVLFLAFAAFVFGVFAYFSDTES